MAHAEQFEFFKKLQSIYSDRFSTATRIFEVGSQDINGTVRPFFSESAVYIGVDLGPAKCVDWVMPGELVELSDGWADIVISTECFEHCENWHLVFLNMLRLLRSGGLFIFTCAAVGRAAHGTIDSDEFSSPFTTSYYKNLDVDQVVEKIKLGSFFDAHGFEVNSKSGDLYFWGIRSAIPFDQIESHWSSPLDRLARAQGQLAQAAHRHQAISLEASQARAEAAEARAETDRLRAEAEQLRVEADRLRLEADDVREAAEAEVAQARAESDQARVEAVAEVAQARAESDQARVEAEQAKAEAEQANSQLQMFVESNIWRLTRPLRKTKDRLSRQLAAFAIKSPVHQPAAPEESLPVETPPAIDQSRIDVEVQAIKESGLFDEAYYLAMYPDLDPVPLDPIRHYCEVGWIEGRNPSDDFDTCGYLDAYGDIENAGLNPFWHYVFAGAAEARQAKPRAISWYEDDAYFGNLSSDIKVIAYYERPDWNSFHETQLTHKGVGQLHIPHDDLGYYASTPDCLVQQAEMASRHGVCAWCFTVDAAHPSKPHDPLPTILATPATNIGLIVDLNLLAPPCDERVVSLLQKVLTDRRYLHINGRPVLVVTLPAEETLFYQALVELKSLLRDASGLPPFLIARCEVAASQLSSQATTVSFEAVLDFEVSPFSGKNERFMPFIRGSSNAIPYSVVVSQAIASMAESSVNAMPHYSTISLGYDGPFKTQNISAYYSNFMAYEYRRWLDAAIQDVRQKHDSDRRLVFLKAWNDWNRRAVLEPDRHAGYGKLNELSRALLGMPLGLALPKVSIIVPNYNHATYLPRRLESIYCQTYTNIEVLLLDDASTDNSRDLLTEYANGYPEITRTLFNQVNSGSVFRQWAKGIQAATGDLVWIAESDDFCSENFLETLVRCFDDQAVMLAYSKSVFVRADESVMSDEFEVYVRDLSCPDKWSTSYVNTAHQEVTEALGIINTIPNASGVVFRRPVEMPLLEDEAWLSMRVVGDWIFYLHQLRGGKVAYSTETTNYFRRYEGSAAETYYQKHDFYRELAFASLNVHRLYDVPRSVLNQSRSKFKEYYDRHVGRSEQQFLEWFDMESISHARSTRGPNIVVSTQGFYPGGAEILPIRLANEFKRQGHSVILLSGGHGKSEYGVRQMLRRDIPVIETSDVAETRQLFHDFGIEVLNSHQWHVQKYPTVVRNVFRRLKAHVASLHGMVEYGDAFGVTATQLETADKNVTTWVYTAEKNLGPFIQYGLYKADSPRFVKVPNGMEVPSIKPIRRSDIGLPEDAFVLCCVSRAIPEKGWSETIEAVSQARQISGKDIRLILVGNGPIHDEYCRSGVPSFVYLAGFDENSVGFYAASDAGIMLSKFKSESFPLTIVDCLFAGRPFIATSIGEIRNILTTEHGLAGEVMELKDWEVPVSRAAQVIATFASDLLIYQSAKERALEAARRYRIDVVANQYLELFARDIKSARSPAV